MAPLLAQVISADVTPVTQWFVDNWAVIGSAGLVAVLDFIFNNNPDIQHNTLLDLLYNKLLRPFLTKSAPKKPED